MENQHKKIQGYRELDEVTVDLINHVKDAEKRLADIWLRLHGTSVDKRELALARTHFEQGFMHLVKSLARPETPWQ